jgi:hypothetical protein
MKKFLETLKWILKAWPVLLIIAIALIHFLVYSFIQYKGESVNRVTGSILQLIGGLVVLFSINKDIGIFKHGNLFSMVKNWFKAFPLIKKTITLNVASGVFTTTFGTPTITIKHKFNTVGEKLEELERQIDEYRKIIFDRENTMMERLSSIQSKLEGSILKTNNEVQDVKKLLDESVVGSFKEQIFGVLLVIYGAVLMLL